MEVEHSREDCFIGSYSAAPYFMQDNDKIQRGYRINFTSKRQLLRSLFMVHNESVDIWTHLLPLLILVGVLCGLWMTVDHHVFKK